MLSKQKSSQKLTRTKTPKNKNASPRRSKFRLDVEALYRFFEHSNIGLCVVNRQNQIIEYNDALIKLLGYSGEELESLSNTDLTHPDDLEAEIALYRQKIEREQDNSYTIEKRIKRKDGTYIWAKVTASHIRDKKGHLQYGVGIIEDITERKETEARLLESEERFRIVSEMVSDYAYSYRVNEDGSLVREWITDAATRITGYSIQELLNRDTWLTAVHPSDVTLSKAKLNEVLNGKPVEYELRIITKDGNLRWVRDYAFPIKDSYNQRVVRIYGAVTDITEQKKSQEELSRSEARFRQLFELSPIGIGIVEYGGKFIEVNPALCKLFGYTRDELLQMSAADISDPDDMKANLRAYDVLLIDEIDYTILNKRYITKDGRKIVAELHLRALKTDSGNTPLFMGQLIDITDYQHTKEKLEESERRFRLLIQNSSDVTAVINQQGIITYISPSIEAALGYKPEELIGRDVFRGIHPNDMAKSREAHEKILNDVQRLQFECCRRHRDGSWRYFEVMMNRQLDEPTIRGIVLNIRDITERKQIQQQLLQSQKMEAIGALAGGMAHDFNNIMTSVLVAAQLLKAKPDPDKNINRIEKIERAVQRGKGIVEKLLFFARNKKSEMTLLDCSAVIEQVIDIIEHSFPKQIQIEKHLIKPLNILGDVDHLYQVFLNIAINARDAMTDGGTLSFQAEHFYDSSKKQSFAVVHITDTGTGIPDEVKERMFEPFFTTKEVGKGTGLGLAIVHGIMKEHRGAIQVESKVGKGTRFSLYFPLALQESRD
jgi:PAS domain S-box-containing protein